MLIFSTNSPEGQPDIEADDIQPKESRQKSEIS